MNRLVRGIRISGSQTGFTLVEFLTAVVVISLGLVAVGAVEPGQATRLPMSATNRKVKPDQLPGPAPK